MKKKIIKLFNLLNTKTKKYISKNILFLSYLIVSLLISLLLRAITVGFSFSLKPILCDLMISLLIGSLGYFVKPKNRFIYFLVIICVFTFLGIANSIYYTFYKSFLSISLLNSLKMVGEVESSVFSKLKFIDLLFFVFPVIFLLIHKQLSKKSYYIEALKTEHPKKMFVGTLRVSLIILFLVVVTITGTEASRFFKNWNREYVVQRFGLYTYTINDFFQSLQPKISTLIGYDTSAREFREFYKEEINSKKVSSNKYSDIFEEKNILVIHAESIQNFLINLKINDVEITPNLNKLAKESLYFSKFYPQIGTGTSSDTEFTYETGLLPSTSAITFNSYFDREYESIPLILKEKGYYTFSMHANNGDYWNRNVMYKTLGYDNFYSESSYFITEENIIGLGLSDKEFFKQITPIIRDASLTKKPFYAKVVTLTNHSPFDEIEKYGALNLSMSCTYIDEYGYETNEISNYLEGTEMGNYLKSAHYADEALGEFLELLEENDILKDTVIVLYGDHEAKISKNQFNLMYNYDCENDSIKNEESEDYISFENYKYDILKNTPLMIYLANSPYIEEVKDVMGMYDLLPTLANLFNFDYTYAMGHDVFENYEKIVIFPNGNFITNKVYYNNLKGDYITLSDDPLEIGYIERLKKYSEKRLSVANNLIVHDLIRKEEVNLLEELNEKK